jgi:hypothetical protein
MSVEADSPFGASSLTSGYLLKRLQGVRQNPLFLLITVPEKTLLIPGILP